jgi:hypothetical protein
VDACNPLLQAHPTWARDKHEGRGISTSHARLPPAAFPLRALSRTDPSGLGHAATVYSSVQGPPGLETPTVLIDICVLMQLSFLPPPEPYDPKTDPSVKEARDIIKIANDAIDKAVDKLLNEATDKFLKENQSCVFLIV